MLEDRKISNKIFSLLQRIPLVVCFVFPYLNFETAEIAGNH